MISLTEAEKVFGEIQHLFLKTLCKPVIEWNLLKLMERIYENPTASTIPDGEIALSSLRSGTVRGCPLSPLPLSVIRETVALTVGYPRACR